MNISNELQIGKAGEHFVCCDLIRQGLNAFLADQGLPYDLVVDTGIRLLRVQVKATLGLTTYGKVAQVYRFGTRKGRRGRRAARADEVDYYAFVALDIYAVAYIPIAEMVARTGGIKTGLDFKSRAITYTGRVYPNGTVRSPAWGKHLQDFGVFKI